MHRNNPSNPTNNKSALRLPCPKVPLAATSGGSGVVGNGSKTKKGHKDGRSDLNLNGAPTFRLEPCQVYYYNAIVQKLA